MVSASHGFRVKVERGMSLIINPGDRFRGFILEKRLYRVCFFQAVVDRRFKEINLAREFPDARPDGFGGRP